MNLKSEAEINDKVNEMRDLTQQEIDNAPEWATHYDVLEAEMVPNYTCYYGDNCSQWAYHGTGDKSPVMHRVILPSQAKPIPRKEFDITKHEFWDESITDIRIDSQGDFEFRLKPGTEEAYLTKKDFIAGAKHFKLTAADLL